MKWWYSIDAERDWPIIQWRTLRWAIRFLRRPYLLLACLAFAQPAACAPKWLAKLGQITGHLAIGGGTALAVNQVAGHNAQWPGVVAAAPVAFFKEYTDAHDHKDTIKQAIIHALTIEAGAGLVARVKH